MPRGVRTDTQSRPVLETLERRLLLDAGPVVINEIHYDPDVPTELTEFIELYNAGDAPVDLAGWALTNAVDYTFPAGTSIPAGGYVVVAQDLADFQAKFSKTALGPWVGTLGNDGETITLRDQAGTRVDEVSYQRGFPWPTAGESPGYSIELVNPALDNDLGGSWRISIPGAAGDPDTLVANGQSWKYFKGVSEASSPTSAWRLAGFNDTSWLTGVLPIGYGESFIATNLSDMRGGYTTVFLRKTFTIADPGAFESLVMEAMYDDGFNAWINGVHVTRQNLPSAEMAYNTTTSGSRENGSYSTINLPDPSTYLVAGTNVLTVQLHNVSLSSSSDAFFDCRLKTTATVTMPGPTPGGRNAAYATNVAPHMRQLDHSPNQPAGGEPVTVTIKVTDSDGVQSVVLSYQIVEPGAYIDLEDPAYVTNWTTVAMVDDGTGGDEQAGDSIYTVVLPGSMQVHRRLIRYRVTASDALGLTITGPYEDDPVPNFAYFVYNGVPSWTGAIDPDSADPALSTPVTYSSAVLNSVPVYHLIAKKDSVEHSQWIDKYGGDLYPWGGTLVYDGVVYDHVHYRARGGVWRYAMGKNMWKFDFNRGHGFQAVDDFGHEYSTQWDKLNLGACIQQGDYLHRGEQGMFEAAGFKMFNLLGVESPLTTYVHFRVIDEAAEAGATQYDGDFWGLYLAVEQPDGRMLDEHGLPDGNLYKMEGGGDLNNQGPTAVTDKSDLNAFLNTYTNTTPSEQWWRENLNLESYYSYRSIVEAIHHYDIASGKNYFYYLNPETNLWSVHPWDLDLTWANNMYGSGDEPFNSRVANVSPFNLEYRNRLREVRDLLYNVEQMYPLLNELAAIIDTAGGPSLVDADRALWDYNPIMTSAYVNLSKAGEGRFYQMAATKDFPGMVQLMKDYVVSRGAWIDSNLLNDSAIPNTPTISYTGPAGFPINRLTFHTSAFSDTTGYFQAMEWRIGEVTSTSAPCYDPEDPLKFEVVPVWESGEITAFDSEGTIPPEALKVGHAYRVRVRMKDSTGRWSHWSAPVQFIAGEQDSTELTRSLRITEIMYHPAVPTPQEAAAGFNDYDDFEYVEVRNVGSQTLDISGVRFINGVDFSFAGTTVTSLAPGEFVVVVSNTAAFEYRYGEGAAVVAGEFANGTGLSDGGEKIELLDTVDGTILKFTYSDSWYPITDGEGFSLTVADELADATAWDDSDNWQASAVQGGTPGTDDSGLPRDAIVISEVLAHTDDADGDWIELHNTTTEDIDIGGWFLSDSSDGLDGGLTKFQIAPGTVLPAGAYVVFTQADDFGPIVHPGGFALSELGDDVFLSSGVDGQPGGYRQHVDFGASQREVSFGRYVKTTGGSDFVAMVERTPGADNSYPLVGPVVLNEIMYHPLDGKPGYVELYNFSDSPVLLYDSDHPANTWRLADAVEFVFPQGVSIPAGGYLIVASTDATTLRAQYSVPAGVAVYGPWTGNLDNAGENLKLYRPTDPEPTGEVPYVLVERVKYDDELPWPLDADGNGSSLSRQIPAGYANDADNWAPSMPGGTPGSLNIHNDLSPPSAPTGVVATAVTSHRIDLTWQPAVDSQSGVDHYVIYRNGLAVGTSPTCSFSNAGLTETTTYEYRVSAVNPSGHEGGRSSSIYATPRPSLQWARVVDATHVTVGFGKAVEQTSAETIANYTVLGPDSQPLAIVGAVRQADPAQVTLSLGSVIVEEESYTLSVQHVRDLAGNEVEDGSQVVFFYRDVDPDLLAWWTFDEGAGAIETDATGNARNLELVGVTRVDEGRIGKAAQFNGSAYAVDEDGEAYINGLSAVTVAMWIQAEATDTDRGFFTTQPPGATSCLNIRHDAKGWGGGEVKTFRFVVQTTGGKYTAEGYGGTQTVFWQHVALTWADGQDAMLYLNGVPQEFSWEGIVGSALTGVLSGATKVLVGQGDTTGANWVGLIDDVRIYSRALSEADVRALANLNPQAVDEAYETSADGSLNVAAGAGVLANDADADSGPAGLSAHGVSGPEHGQLALNEDGSFQYTPTPGYTGPDSFTYQAYDGLEYSNVATVSITVGAAVPPASVRGQYVFYNNSKFDNPSKGFDDDDAIAPDKSALMPGGTATFDNYTSYSLGLNGLMIDVANLADGGDLTAADFSFKKGNNSTPSGWSAAAAPISILLREGEGVDGSDRITLIWADNAVQKTWLEVTVLATARTGLDEPYVFYFGNAIGESGDNLANAYVDSGDRLGARANPRGVFNPAPIDFKWDYNRDGLVDSGDRLIARANATSAFTALKLIVVPDQQGQSEASAPADESLAAEIEARAIEPSSPKGSQNTAQGIALGIAPVRSEALKGREDFSDCPPVLSPLQGSFLGGRFPGRCPGLYSVSPSGSAFDHRFQDIPSAGALPADCPPLDADLLDVLGLQKPRPALYSGSALA